MARFRDFLTRFRPVGLPGPAAAGGVPADRTAELAAELAPPLALLDTIEAESRGVRENAAREAARRREEAERTAAEIVGRARARAAGERAEIAERLRTAGRAEAAELPAATERELDVVRGRVARRLPALADRIVAEVTAELRREPGRPPWAPGG